MDPQIASWITAGAFASIAAFAFVADHRRSKRQNLDKVGWVPWNAVQIFAIIAAAAAIALAIKG